MSEFHELIDFTQRVLNIDDATTQQYAHHLSRQFAGSRIYVSAHAEQRKERDREIRRSFNGKNISALARLYGLSERQIYNIVNG